MLFASKLERTGVKRAVYFIKIRYFRIKLFGNGQREKPDQQKKSV